MKWGFNEFSEEGREIFEKANIGFPAIFQRFMNEYNNALKEDGDDPIEDKDALLQESYGGIYMPLLKTDTAVSKEELKWLSRNVIRDKYIIKTDEFRWSDISAYVLVMGKGSGYIGCNLNHKSTKSVILDYLENTASFDYSLEKAENLLDELCMNEFGEIKIKNYLSSSDEAKEFIDLLITAESSEEDFGLQFVEDRASILIGAVHLW